MDEAAEALVSFTDGVRFDALPPSAVHAARRVLVDSVGCAVAAAREPTIVGLQQLAQSFAGSSGLLVHGRADHPGHGRVRQRRDGAVRTSTTITSAARATLARTPATTWAGSCRRPNSPGGRRGIVEGVIVAYEVVCQLIDQVRPLGRKRTWDYTVFHAAATALAAGRMLGFTRDQLSDALSLAVGPEPRAQPDPQRRAVPVEGAGRPVCQPGRPVRRALLARAGLARPTRDSVRGPGRAGRPPR